MLEQTLPSSKQKKVDNPPALTVSSTSVAVDLSVENKSAPLSPATASQKFAVPPGRFARLPVSLLRQEIIPYLNLQLLGYVARVSQFFWAELQKNHSWKQAFICHFPQDWRLLSARERLEEINLRQIFWQTYEKNYNKISKQNIKLLTLVKEGDLSRFQAACKEFTYKTLDCQDNGDCNLLDWASRYRHQHFLTYFYQQVSHLYRKGNGKKAMQRDKNKNTLLNWASLCNQLDAVQALLVNGVDINVKNNEGDTPLYCATASGHRAVCHLLLKNKVDPRAPCTDNGSTPLYVAAENGHTEIAKLLLEAKADPRAACTDDGSTPLYMAAQEGHTEIAKLLLKAKADSRAERTDGATPLYIAAENGHTEVIKLLLATNADPQAPPSGKARATTHLNRGKAGQEVSESKTPMTTPSALSSSNVSSPSEDSFSFGASAFASDTTTSTGQAFRFFSSSEGESASAPALPAAFAFAPSASETSTTASTSTNPLAKPSRTS